jgi:hypothetical protein
VIALLVAVYTAVLLNRHRLRPAWPLLAVFATFFVGLLLLLHGASYRALVTGPDPVITGRYLLPLVPLAGLLFAWLIGTLPRRPRWLAAGGLLTLLLVMQLGGLAMTVVRFHV